MSFNGDLYPTAGADVVMTTSGDMVKYESGARARLGIGSANQILQVKSSLPSWETLSTAGSVLTTQGDILYEGASALARLGQSTNFHTLATKGSGANPAWQASATSTMTAAQDVLYSSSANTLARLAAGSDGDVLTTHSTGSAPTWETPSGVSLSADNTWTGTNIFNNFVSSTPTELTLSSGVVTATRMCHEIDTEGDASTDDCSHIRGEGVGRLLFVQTATADRDVTFVDEQGGNGTLNMAGDFTEDGNTDVLCFIGRFSDGNTWSEISRSNNGN